MLKALKKKIPKMEEELKKRKLSEGKTKNL
jgi:hypothetical protein